MKYFSAMERFEGEMRPRPAYGIEFTHSGQLYAVGFDKPAIEGHLAMLNNFIPEAFQLVELKVTK